MPAKIINTAKRGKQGRKPKYQSDKERKAAILESKRKSYRKRITKSAGTADASERSHSKIWARILGIEDVLKKVDEILTEIKFKVFEKELGKK
jgi:hypothetical protein